MSIKWGVVAQSSQARDSCKKILDRAETYVSYFVFLVTNIKNDDVLIKLLTVSRPYSSISYKSRFYYLHGPKFARANTKVDYNPVLTSELTELNGLTLSKRAEPSF